MLQISAQPSTPITVDQGQSIPVNVLATGGSGNYIFTWISNSCQGVSASGTGNSFTYSPTATTSNCIFTFTANDGFTSNTSNTATISVNPLLQISAQSSSNTAVYIGSNVLANAIATGGSSSFTYTWVSNSCPGISASGTGSSLTYTPNAPTSNCQFTFTANDGITTNSASTGIISVFATPTVSVAPTTQSKDVGQSITITATPGSLGSGSDTYEWFNTTSGTPVNTDVSGLIFTQNTVLTGTFTYNVVVTDSNGITNTSNTASVTVTQLPTISVAPSSQTEDVGQTISITGTVTNAGSGGDSFQWYNTTSGIAIPITGANSLVYSTNAGAAGTFTYNIVITDSNGGTGTSTTATVTVSTVITVTAQPSISATIDVGQSIPVNAIGHGDSGTFTYTWTANNCPGIATSGTGNVFTYIPTGTTTNCQFTFTANDGITSNSTSTALISVTPAPAITATPSTQNVDVGQTITIAGIVTSAGSGGDSFQWYNTTSGSAVLIGGATSNAYTATATPTGTFTYNVVVTDSDGMAGSSNVVTVIVSPLPTISVAPSSQTEDVGQPISITGTVTNAGSGGDSFQWYNTTSGIAIPITGANSLVYSTNAGAAGTFTYNIVITDSNGGTGTSTTATVTVSTVITVTAQPSISATIDVGQSIPVNAIGHGDSGTFTYTWTANNCPGIATSGTGNVFTYIPTGTTTNCQFTFTANDGITSNSTSTALITVVPTPTITATPTSQNVDAGQSITIAGIVTNVGSGGDTFQWYNTTLGTPVIIGGATSNTYTAAASSTGTFTYNVVVTDSNHGTGTSNPVSVTVSPLPTISVAPQSQGEDPGQTITLTGTVTNTGSGGDSFQWYNTTSGAPILITGANTLVYSPTASAKGTFTYNIVITDSNAGMGNSTTATVVVATVVTVTAQPSTPTTIDLGQSVPVNAIGHGDSGNFVYSWTANNSRELQLQEQIMHLYTHQLQPQLTANLHSLQMMV